MGASFIRPTAAAQTAGPLPHNIGAAPCVRGYPPSKLKSWQQHHHADHHWRPARRSFAPRRAPVRIATGSVCVCCAHSASGASASALQHMSWAAADGVQLEILHRPAAGGGSHGKRPPLVFVHGLFRAAWCFDEAWLPHFSAQGYDCYAISLRGQGASEVGDQVQALVEQHGGVQLAVHTSDLAGFIASLRAPPVLVAHSLGGYVLQEYLSQLAQCNSSSTSNYAASSSKNRGSESSSSGSGDSSSSGGSGGSSSSGGSAPVQGRAGNFKQQGGHLPPVEAAVLLASPTAGTLFAIHSMLAEMGLPEFLFQVFVVATRAHMRSQSIAQYCWWDKELPQEHAARYLAAIRSSSRVLPYITAEVQRWDPPGFQPGAGPHVRVLALGGAMDRICQPFQVHAAAERWGADVQLLPWATHDMMLGPNALRVAQHLQNWLEQPQEQHTQLQVGSIQATLTRTGT